MDGFDKHDAETDDETPELETGDVDRPELEARDCEAPELFADDDATLDDAALDDATLEMAELEAQFEAVQYRIECEARVRDLVCTFEGFDRQEAETEEERPELEAGDVESPELDADD